MERLRLPFQQCSPDVDETAIPNEQAKNLVRRLAQAKMQAVLDRLKPDNAILISSDQVALFNDVIIGKPKDTSHAIRQLLSFSKQSVIFYTSLCVYDTESARQLDSVEETSVRFRKLTEEEVKRYIELDQPLNAAGSFHAEKLGITLFEAIVSEDPTSLIGLPLIRLTSFLNQLGLPVLAHTP